MKPEKITQHFEEIDRIKSEIIELLKVSDRVSIMFDEIEDDPTPYVFNKYLIINKEILEMFKVSVVYEDVHELSLLIKYLDVLRDNLVNTNHRLVESITSKYFDMETTKEDMFNDGIIGLVRSIGTYDYSQDVNFSTFATPWIRYFTQKELGKYQIIRKPKEVNARTSTVLEYCKKFIVIKGYEPRIVDIVIETGLTEKQVKEALDYSTEPISMDEKIDSEEDDMRMQDNIAIDDTTYCDKLVTEEIHKALVTLPFTQRDIVQRYYGIGKHKKPQTMQEIGDTLGYSFQWISLTLKDALNNIYIDNKVRLTVAYEEIKHD